LSNSKKQFSENAGKEGPNSVKHIVKLIGCLLLLVFASGIQAQIKVGDNLSMNMSGLLTGGYAGNYGDEISSSHNLEAGGNVQLNGSYYNPNFINFAVDPYYNQSRANSSFQSLTDSSGVTANVNFFTGSHFPGYASYDYARNSTGNFGLVGNPNFTTVGNSQGFGIGWSALLPDWPTFSVSYSQGNGNGTIYGTNEESRGSTKTLNVRSTYEVGGWRLAGQYEHLNINSDIPYFLSGDLGTNFADSTGNSLTFSGIHSLPWHGSIALTFNHSTYSGEYGSSLLQNTGTTDYTTNIVTANASFRPTAKLGLYVSQSYTDNLNGYLYQNIINGGGGIPIIQLNSQASSSTLSAGANYTFTPNLYAQAQMTYYDQTYFGNSYQGTYFSGTVGYGKRILDTFTVSASIIQSSNKFANNSTGFIGNLNAFRRFGGWEVSGGFSYAQNIQTLLVTYTTSYYNYNGNLHRRLGRGMQWTGAVNGNHSGFTQQPGTINQSEGFSTSLALRRIDLTANYIQARGQALLTSTGITPIPPIPGLPQEGLIVYDGKSYGAGVSMTPIRRLTISATYSHAMSDTLSNTVPSSNKTDIFYGQVQYRLRKISLLGGYTKFYQGISAAGTPPGNEYSYFVGVTRWFNFF
jgi:hypothetical protein